VPKLSDFFYFLDLTLFVWHQEGIQSVKNTDPSVL